MASDDDVLKRVKSLVEEEHVLRGEAPGPGGAAADERLRLAQLERELDQCWDLLRQRQALRASGRDPGDATVRPVEQVEKYLG